MRNNQKSFSLWGILSLIATFIILNVTDCADDGVGASLERSLKNQKKSSVIFTYNILKNIMIKKVKIKHMKLKNGWVYKNERNQKNSISFENYIKISLEYIPQHILSSIKEYQLFLSRKNINRLFFISLFFCGLFSPTKYNKIYEVRMRKEIKRAIKY